jgi:hypothetical protein
VSKCCSSSRDYILLGGTRELLSHMKWQDPANQDHPWSEPDWHKNKKIIEEYLEYVINDVEKNLADKLIK